MKRFIIAALLVGVAGAASAQGRQAVVPGTGMTPEELALMNMMSKLGGMGEPFGPLLDNYYKQQMMLQQQQRHEEILRELRNLRRGR